MKSNIVNIYLIENLINHKVYIGQTKSKLEVRFRQHFNAANSTKNSNKFFHKLLWDLGKQYFQIRLLETCSKENANEREQYYINKYQSTDPKKGYNERASDPLTVNILNNDQFEKNILELYNQKHLTISRIAKQLHKSHRVIREILNKYNIHKSSGEATKETHAFPLSMLDFKNHSIIKTFKNQYEAVDYIREIGKSNSSYDNILKNIQMAARKLTKSAYGFIWQKDAEFILENRKSTENKKN